jgi:hypothetical protein
VTENLPDQYSPAWYKKLVEDCHVIRIEFWFKKNMTEMEGYYEIGKRILDDNNNFDRAKIYGQKLIDKLKNSLGINEKYIRASMRLAKEYKTFDDLISFLNVKDGKNLNMRTVMAQIEGREDKPKEGPEYITCTQCKGKGKIKKEVL